MTVDPPPDLAIEADVTSETILDTQRTEKAYELEVKKARSFVLLPVVEEKFMECQRLRQTKNAIAPSNRENAIARHSPHPIEELQGAIGNRVVNQLLANQPVLQAKPMFGGLSRELVIQPKLTIAAARDKYEREADRVASQVVQKIHAPVTAQSTQGQSIQRQQEPEELQAKPSISSLQRSPLCPEIQAEAMPKQEQLQAQSTLQHQAAVGGGQASTDLESAINCTRGSGQPLDVALQGSMGQVMGADFSGVRVHTDARSDQLNQWIQAKAFTTGQDVFFRQGTYQPRTQGGQELIAHELTHVVQQNGGAVQRLPQPQAQLQPYRLIQRVLHGGVDPLIGYLTPNNHSLLYGIHTSRQATQQRLGVQDAGMGGVQPLRTIDEYNASVGINALMTPNMSAVGLFTVREALADINPVVNWGNYFPSARATVAANLDLQMWISKLVAQRNTIGLYDFGDQTKAGMLGFRRRVGANLINSKNRFRKNLGDPALGYANDITPKEINSFLRLNRTFNQALTVFQAMPPTKQIALNQWVYKAFFRRTSKLGIDFAMNDLHANVNFNTRAAIDHTSTDPGMSTPSNKGLKMANLLTDQSQNRAITISELRHITKGLRHRTITPAQVNFYDED